MRKAIAAIIPLAVVVAALVVNFQVGVLMLRGAYTLVSGWARYFDRVAGEIQVDSLAVVWGLIIVAAVAVMVHWLGRSFSKVPQGSWRWRRTVVLLAAVFLMFVSGTAFVGIVSKVLWIANTDQPLVQTVERYAYMGSTKTEMRTLGNEALGWMSMNDVYVNEVPPDGHSNPVLSWQTQIALTAWVHPADSEELQSYDQSRPWDDGPNATMYRRIMPMFVNPELIVTSLYDERGFALSHYSANSHFINDRRTWTTEQVTDGTSNTLMIGQINAGFVPWGQPGNWRDPMFGMNRDPRGFGGVLTKNDTLFLMADGSIRALSNQVSDDVLRALSTPSGGEPTPPAP